MARLPRPGSDDNTWGDILNDFLKVSLNDDGTIKSSAVSSKLDASEKGQAGGVATLGNDGRLPDAQAPSSKLDASQKGQPGGVAVLGNDGRLTDSQAPSSQVGVDLWTQKGDVIIAVDTNTPTAVNVGTDGQVLTADSAQTTGVRWATPSVNNGNELAWNGSDYEPSSLKADTSKPRTFKGPVNPSTVSGVVMNSSDWFDTWVGGS